MASVNVVKARKNYGSTEVLHGVSVDIADGEFVILVGPSGCGKSTLLRMIAGLESVTSGEILIGERVVNNLPPKERDIAMVFQNYALYPHKTVAENMSFALKLRKTPPSEMEARVRRAAEILDVTPYLARFPRQLSGGQRQRVAIARALLLRPKLLLLDEPTSALDVTVQAEILNLLNMLKQRYAMTLVLVSHDVNVIAHMCDRAALMNSGKIERIMGRDELSTVT